MPRVDLRVRRTRRMLREALLALLREKDVDAISVQSGGFDSRRLHAEQPAALSRAHS